MYEKILNDPLRFGDEFSPEAVSILTSLLNRDPTRRLGVKGAEEIKRHPFFHNHIDFKLLAQKKIQPPFKPSVSSPVVRLYCFGLSCAQHIRRMCPTLMSSSRRKHPLTAMSKARISLPPSRLNSMVRHLNALLVAQFSSFTQGSPTMVNNSSQQLRNLFIPRVSYNGPPSLPLIIPLHSFY